MTVKRNITFNLFANIYSQAVTVAHQLVAVPIFLSLWGMELYGEWLVLYTLPGYLLMCDCGFSSAAINRMTMFYSAGKHKDARKALQAAFVFLISICVLLLVLSNIVLWSVNIKSLLNFSTLTMGQIQIILLSLIIYSFSGMLTRLVSGIFRAVGRNALGVIITSTFRLIDPFIIFILLKNNVAAEILALTLAAKNVLGLIAMVLLSKRISRDLAIGFKYFDLNEVKETMPYGLAYMAMPISNAISNQGFVLIANNSLGAVGVVVYCTVRTLMNTLQKLMAVMNLSVYPEVSMLYAKKDFNSIRTLHRLFVSVSLWMVLLVGAALIIVYPYVLNVWTRGKVEASLGLILAFVSGTLLRSAWYTSSVVLLATNSHKGFAKRLLFSSVVMIIPGVILCRLFGLPGLPIATMLRDILITWYVLKSSCELIDDSCRRFLIDILTLRTVRNVLCRLGGNVLSRRSVNSCN